MENAIKGIESGKQGRRKYGTMRGSTAATNFSAAATL